MNAPSVLDLDARALAFLRESNAIERIENVDYGDPANRVEGRGHAWAFVESQRLAASRVPPTVDDLCLWQRWITSEQREFGHPIPPGGIGRIRSRENPVNVAVGGHTAPDFALVPTLMVALTIDLGTALRALGHPAPAAQTAAVAGEFLFRFETIHPFIDGNGRVGRLLANHIVMWCGLPFILFEAAERETFFAAHASAGAMQTWLAKRLRDSVPHAGRM